MTTWLIQKTKIEEDKINELLSLLEKAEIPYEIVIPREGHILNHSGVDYQFTKGQDYFVCGSYPLSRYAHAQFPGSVFSLEDYSFQDFWTIFGKNNFVNDSAIICHSNDIVWDDEELFIRPLEDNKAFNGGIYNQNTFKYVGNVVTAHLKQISKEHRFFVIDGEIVTGSLYKMNGSLTTSNIIDEGAMSFAKEMIKLFPYDGYVIDIATVGNQYKIMELNCLNASGFYDINLYKLINAVEQHYENRQNIDTINQSKRKLTL